MRYDLTQEVQHLESRQRGTKNTGIFGVSIMIILVMFLIWAADGLVGDEPAPADPFNICNEPSSQLNC